MMVCCLAHSIPQHLLNDWVTEQEDLKASFCPASPSGPNIQLRLDPPKQFVRNWKKSKHILPREMGVCMVLEVRG